MSSKVLSIHVEPLREGGLPSQQVRIETEKGSIYVSRNTVLSTGGSWSAFLRETEAEARDLAVPFTRE